MTVRVTHRRLDQGRRNGQLLVDIDIFGNLTQRERSILLNASKTCEVGKLLNGATEVTYQAQFHRRHTEDGTECISYSTQTRTDRNNHSFLPLIWSFRDSGRRSEPAFRYLVRSHLQRSALSIVLFPVYRECRKYSPMESSWCVVERNYNGRKRGGHPWVTR